MQDKGNGDMQASVTQLKGPIYSAKGTKEQGDMQAAKR